MEEAEMSSSDGADVEEHIRRKYDMKKKLGKGAYGVVWKAVERRSGTIVAVKKIFDAFRNRTDAQRTFREIMLLQEFGDHVNIVKLLDFIPAHNDRDIYLVFEFMDTDLHAVIRRGGLLKDVHQRYIMYQLFRAVKYLHSGNVIHRDQKPSNVLLDSDCVVKLCDFGLARSLNQDHHNHQNHLDLQNHKVHQDPQLTEYVATRWYRAPEILLGSTRYTRGVDMWSLGCILGEMLLGRALFPGSSSSNQVERIMRSIAPPGPDDVASIPSKYGSSVLQRTGPQPRLVLEELLPASTPPDALDLLRNLLVFNPEKRLTAEEALLHPYVARYPESVAFPLGSVGSYILLTCVLLPRHRFHNPAREPALSRDVVLPVHDGVQLSAAQYRKRLYRMIEERRTNQSLLIASQGRERGGASNGSRPQGGEEVRRDHEQEARTQHDKRPATRSLGDDSAPHAAGVSVAGLAAAAHHCRRPAGGVHTDTLLKARSSLSAPQSQSHTFSWSLSHNNPLLRKDEWPLTSGPQNRRREAREAKEARPLPHFSKKVFQNNCNVAAAGDPRAKLGSYSQAYGTINKTQLDLLRGNHGNR